MDNFKTNSNLQSQFDLGLIKLLSDHYDGKKRKYTSQNEINHPIEIAQALSPLSASKNSSKLIERVSLGHDLWEDGKRKPLETFFNSEFIMEEDKIIFQSWKFLDKGWIYRVLNEEGIIKPNRVDLMEFYIRDNFQLLENKFQKIVQIISLGVKYGDLVNNMDYGMEFDPRDNDIRRFNFLKAQICYVNLVSSFGKPVYDSLLEKQRVSGLEIWNMDKFGDYIDESMGKANEIKRIYEREIFD